MNAIANIDYLRASCPSIFSTQASPKMSSKYTFIPTIDAIEALAVEGFDVASAKQSRCRDQNNMPYTKHMVRLRAAGLATPELAPEVILTNAHNGYTRYKAFGGAFRFFCFNGMIVADGRIEAVYIKHSGDVIASVIEGVMRVMSHARETVRVMDDWKQIELSPLTQAHFADRALALRFGKNDNGTNNTLITTSQALEVRRKEDEGNDLWHVFNRVQENMMVGGLDYTKINYNSGRTNVRRLKSRPVRGVDQDVNLNRGLWAIAEEMAVA